MDITNSIAYFKRTWESDEPADINLDSQDLVIDKQFCEGVSVFYIVDQSDQFHFVQKKHLTKSGVTNQELHQQGLSNLADVAEEITITESEGLLYFSGNGNFEASLLLVNHIWDDWLTDYCPNGYIAAIPARDILVVCDKNDSEGVIKLTNIIERIWNGGDHLLSKSLLTYKEKSWEILNEA